KKSLSPEERENSRGLLVPPVLQLLIAMQFYGAGTFRCTVISILVNMSQPTVCWVIGR
ncbi:hypothetical protein HPB47_023483, partial [Ixodes persulcatus]